MTAELIQASRVAAERLSEWLLRGPVQIADGEQAGGVAGILDASDRPRYVYGEITGYYLHWLASPHLPFSPRRVANAGAAAGWVRRRFGESGLPPTRIYLDGSPQTDWRNQAQFCFDLAMLIGGLARAAHSGLIAPPLATLTSLAGELSAFANHSGLRPLIGAPGIEIPDRWSTRSGPFLVKAAARILSAQIFVPIEPELLRACRTQLGRFAPQSIAATADPLHPTLYFLEGSLALQPEHDVHSASVLRALLQLGDAEGSLPESLDTADIRRSDIIAQALRVGVLLAADGNPQAPASEQLDRLARQLVQRVDPDGSIAFRPDAETIQRNVWCAMFAEQALSWYAAWRNGEKLVAGPADIV